ncbi:MAG: hypothetical protein HYV97_04510 [Bdellovibrio sp.]|nr:hypothetical protein [Bdellovibrio sp.]
MQQIAHILVILILQVLMVSCDETATISIQEPADGSTTITAQNGLTVSKTMDITVAFINQRPVAPSFVNNGKIVSKHTYYLTLPAAVDPEGDIIKYRLLETSSITTVTDCLKNNDNLDCTIKVDADNGPVWIKYIASDQYGDASNTTLVEYSLVPNIAPILLTSPASLRTPEDVTFIFTLNGGQDENEDFVTYQLFERPKHGHIRNCLQGNTDLECEYLPDADYYGSDSFSYRAFDGVTYSRASKVNLFVDAINDAPAFAQKNTTLQIDNKDSNKSEIFLPMAADVESPWNSLTYKIITPPGHGQLDGHCSPPAIDQGYKCYFIPEAGYDGDDLLMLQVSDDKGARDTYALTLKIQHIPTDNQAPNLPAEQVFRGNDNKALTLALDKGTDPNRDSLKRIFVSSPNPESGDLFGCFNSPTCTFQPRPGFAGITTFSYKVSDGTLESNVTTVKIIIEKTKPLKIFAGGFNTCALFSNNKFKCWGDNRFGQLRPFGVTSNSYGTDTEDNIKSMKYLDLGETVDLSIGDGFMCAIIYDGHVKCWGRNDLGQLGVGNTQNYSTTDLNQIPYVQDNMGRPYRHIINIRSAAQGTCALMKLTTGHVYCWGKVADHQGLNPADTKLRVPIRPEAEARLEISNHRICVTSKGTDATYNGVGLVRLSTDETKCVGDQFYPAQILGSTPKFRVEFHEFAYNIGHNIYLPEAIGLGARYPLGTSVKYLFFPMGRTVYSYLNLAGQSSFYVAGFERYGRPDLFTHSLGASNFLTFEAAIQFTTWLEPVVGADFYPLNEKGEQLKFAVFPNTLSENNIVKLTGSENHICALSSIPGNRSGQVKCWGKNDRGQLGIDTGSMASVGFSDLVVNSRPVAITSHVTDVAAGNAHTCAVISNYNTAKDIYENDLYCWGDNTRGQFGMLLHNTMSKLPINVFTTRYQDLPEFN